MSDNSSNTTQKPVYATDLTFQSEAIDASKNMPVIVDMYADWCGPCKMIAPIIDKLAAEFAEKVKFVKVDTDANQQLSMNYGIRSIPTLMVYAHGELIFKQPGALPEASLKDLVNQVLSKWEEIGNDIANSKNKDQANYSQKEGN
jgi:thioredoxin